MRIPSTPRRTGARSKPVHFSYVSVERGQPFDAYLAGPVWWGYLHMLKPSKPCVYEITGEQVACRFCGGPRAPVPLMKGWVPLYRRIDGLACCVPVDEAQRDEIDALKCFSKVTVGRGRGKGVGVWVQACLNQEPEWSSSLPERCVPADITESLITMWALPEVTSFFARPVSSDKPVSPVKVEPVAADDDPSTSDPLDARGGVDGAIRRALGRAKQAERNGDGKH
jgi:hypothetical protein